MPQTQKGSWFLHYEDKMDVELIETIKGTIYEIWHVKQRVRSMQERGIKVPRYLRTYLRRLDTDLNKMRSVAVYYKEYSTIENLQLLGESYIKQMKRDLTPKTFQTSILCKRIGIAKDGFYSSMREGHKYNASDFNYLDSLGYDFNDTQLDSRADKDLNPFAPICIGMDYNANINWIVAGQPSGRRLNVIKSFYTKFERKIPALIGTSTWETPCGMMRSTCSSTRALPVNNGSCRCLTVKTMMTSSSPSRRRASCVAATASARTKAVRNSPRPRKTCCSTARTARTLSTPSTSAVKSFRIVIPLVSIPAASYDLA